ncbi:hypothetical protein VB891_002259 [Vibrio cholerae]|nr:hypothetical protein [Vibrio cholerae]
MSLTQDIANMVQAANNLTAEVAGKMSEIDQKTAENSAKVDAELAKIQTKLPRIIITRNQVLDLDSGTNMPLGMSVNAGVTVTEYMNITGNSVKPAEQIALLQEMEADMGCSLRKTAYYRRGFRILKMSWSGSPSWLAFPQAADDPQLTSIPVNTFITLGAFVKVLSGSLAEAWAAGSKTGKWVFCNSKLSPAGFGSYLNLHPIPTTPTGEVLVALPAAITGHIDDAGQWFPNVNLG